MFCERWSEKIQMVLCSNTWEKKTSKQVVTLLKHIEKNIFKASYDHAETQWEKHLQSHLNEYIEDNVKSNIVFHIFAERKTSCTGEAPQFLGHLAENILLYGSLEISQKQMKNKSRKHIPLFWQRYNKDRMRNTCLLTWFKGSGCMAKYVKVTGYKRSTYQVLHWRKICISTVW